MKTRIIFSIVLLLLIGQVSTAQRVGLKGGVNVANLDFPNGTLDFTPEDINLFHLGLVFEGPVLGNLYYNSGILYSEKGYKFHMPGLTEDDSYLGWNKFQYIEVPLNLQLKSLLMKRSYIFVHGGPYAGYAIWGRSFWDNRAWDFDFERANISRLDYGLGFGGGLELGNIIFSFTYQKGYANLNESSGPEIKNKLYQFSITLMGSGK